MKCIPVLADSSEHLIPNHMKWSRYMFASYYISWYSDVQ